MGKNLILQEKTTRHKQVKGRVNPGRIKTCVVQRSVTRKPLPRAVSRRHSQFRVLTSLQSFSPSFSKRLPGRAPARPGSTNPPICPRQDVRPEGGWVGATPSPAPVVGRVPSVPAPLSLQRAEPAPALSGIRQCHRLRGSLCCRGEDGDPSSTPSVHGIPLAPPSHPYGHRGNSSSAPPLLCASRSQQHHLDFSARKCLL